MARLELYSAGFNMPNIQILTLMLFCALRVGTSRAAQLLPPLNHQIPRAKQQCDQLLERMRRHGQLAERSPGNIGGIFSGRSAGIHHAEICDTPATMPNSMQNDEEPTESTTLL
eukprot:2039742-Pyramimonas_sp.AAC.1